jgi:hypothetical protein
MYVLIAIFVALVFVFRYVRRLNDPNDYASLHVPYEPRISIARFQGLRDADPLSYDAGIAAIREFSRLFQSSFLHETDPHDVVKKMAHSRQRMHKEFHALRLWLPNDMYRERRLVQGIEEVDDMMARALADVAARFPQVKLYFGAGVLSQAPIRAADDTWR